MFLIQNCFYIYHTFYVASYHLYLGVNTKFLHLTTFFYFDICVLLTPDWAHYLCSFYRDIKMQFKFLLFFVVFYVNVCICAISCSFCKMYARYDTAAVMKRDAHKRLLMTKAELLFFVCDFVLKKWNLRSRRRIKAAFVLKFYVFVHVENEHINVVPYLSGMTWNDKMK